MIFCAHTQEGEGLVVPGTKRHVHLFEVRTLKYARGSYGFSSLGENASHALLARLT